MYMVKNLAIKETRSHIVSRHPDSELVTKDFKSHLGKLFEQKLGELIYHTDQGSVSMSDNHISMCKLLAVQQSMSRRGNCFDNAPIEIFFGHMKDKINFKTLKSLEDAKIMVGKFIKYYNFDSPQWI